jgi:integrase
MKGSIRAHGAGWQIKYDLPSQNGRRVTRYKTVRGSKKDAQRELRRLLSAVDDGSHVEPSKLTVAEYCQVRIDQWQGAGNISALTAEGYRRLLADYIAPHIGATALQKLGPADVETWHNSLRARVGARSIGAAHRVLSHALKDAVRFGVVTKNVASLERPPKVDASEVQVVAKEKIAELIAALRGRPMFAPAITSLFTGLRRGEVLALEWRDVELDRGLVRVTKALEETRAHGIRLKSTKTTSGRRDVTLPDVVITALQDHRRRQLEIRMALGAGRMSDDALVFPDPLTGKHQSPRNFSKAWARCAAGIGFGDSTFHSLRHSHASQLIDAGIDVVTIARRLGHAKPTTTLAVYAHLFRETDSKASDAINAALAGLGQ